jgi:hypothetical protein
MLWLGADPRRKGPCLDSRFEDDPGGDSTALEEACSGGKLDALRKFKPTVETDDLHALLRTASHLGYIDIVRYLLTLGLNINDKENTGSSALDCCFWHLEFEDRDHIRDGRAIRRFAVYNTIATLTELLKAGALWRPDDRSSSVRFRRTLLKCEPDLVLEILKLLKTHEAITVESMRGLLDVPAMLTHLKGHDWHLQRLGALARPSSLPTYVPYGLLARFDREQLYEEVWSQPMRGLARKYGVSDVALAKTCRKLKIPVPGRGYWAKLVAGKRMKSRPPLPEFPATPRK